MFNACLKVSSYGLKYIIIIFRFFFCTLIFIVIFDMCIVHVVRVGNVLLNI